jgi:hypothetical protein
MCDALQFIPSICFTIVYSFLPHKELRFLFPVLPLFTGVAAVGLAKFFLCAYGGTNMIENMRPCTPISLALIFGLRCLCFRCSRQFRVAPAGRPSRGPGCQSRCARGRNCDAFGSPSAVWPIRLTYHHVFSLHRGRCHCSHHSCFLGWQP